MKNIVKTVYLICSLIFVLNSSCKKDDEIVSVKRPQTVFDTIKPENYLCAYPKSYWKYVNANNDTVISKTGDGYILDSYTPFGVNNPSPQYYVTTLDGRPAWGASLHLTVVDPPLELQIKDAPVGTSWSASKHPKYSVDYFKKIIARDSSVTIFNKTYYPTVVVETYLVNQNNPPYKLRTQFYTRDIGLIMQLEHTSNTTTIVKQIVSYKINGK